MNSNTLMIGLVVLVVGGIGFFALTSSTSKEMENEETTPIEQTQSAGEIMEKTDEESGMLEADAMNIVEVAADAGTFTTLLAAAEAAGLVDVLTSEGPLTVFAPTDEAFAKLPAGTVEGLLENPEELAQILKYHVVAGKVTSDQVVELNSATTIQGQDIDVMVDGTTVMVNDATVITADVMASNGVIHIIDSVLLPE